MTARLAVVGIAASLAARAGTSAVSPAAGDTTTQAGRSAPSASATATATASPAPVQSDSPAPPPAVVLDPGHNCHNGGNAAAPAEINRPVPAGGFTKPCNTTGTATDAGYPEHAFTLDIALRTAELLRARGVTVVLTRTDDAGVGPCVDARAAIANHAGADLTVSIHADGAVAGARGFHVIEPALAPDHGNAGILTASEDAALDLRTAFGAATGHPLATYPGALVEPDPARRDDLAGLNLARGPAVFIECANMRNPEDASAVTDPEWRQRAAKGITDGVLAYLAQR